MEEKLRRAYESIDTLRELNLPVSQASLEELKELESKFLDEVFIPKLCNELKKTSKILRNNFDLNIKWDCEKLSIQRVSKVLDEDRKSNHSKKLLKVTFEDGECICRSMSSKTFADVVRKIGPKQIELLNIINCSKNLVFKGMHPNPQYRTHHADVGDGYNIVNAISTERKVAFLKTIANQLGITMSIELIHQD